MGTVYIIVGFLARDGGVSHKRRIKSDRALFHQKAISSEARVPRQPFFIDGQAVDKLSRRIYHLRLFQNFSFGIVLAMKKEQFLE
jgi:hypothetical protein